MYIFFWQYTKRLHRLAYDIYVYVRVCVRANWVNYPRERLLSFQIKFGLYILKLHI